MKKTTIFYSLDFKKKESIYISYNDDCYSFDVENPKSGWKANYTSSISGKVLDDLLQILKEEEPAIFEKHFNKK